jgi:hypothetical protein
LEGSVAVIHEGGTRGTDRMQQVPQKCTSQHRQRQLRQAVHIKTKLAFAVLKDLYRIRQLVARQVNASLLTLPDTRTAHIPTETTALDAPTTHPTARPDNGHGCTGNSGHIPLQKTRLTFQRGDENSDKQMSKTTGQASIS